MRDSQIAPLSQRPLSPYLQRDPFALFRGEMSRLFEDFFAPVRAGFDFAPALDVTETDSDIRVVADLPGLDEKDVEVSLDGDLLTIKGERRHEHEEEGRDRRVFERAYGVFERSVRLPFAPGDKACDARFRKGVLTVTVAKPPEAAHTAKRIPIGKA